jgi:hypothetical protein
MKEEFEYGELVEVRDYNNDEWTERRYFGTMPGCKVHWCFKWPQNDETFDGDPKKWKQIRKIQNSEPIEHLVGRIQTQVMSLMDRVGKIENELHPDNLEPQTDESNT